MAVSPDAAGWAAALDGGLRQIAAIPADASYRTSRWLFLRGLGLVYLTAFLSLWPQLRGLIGEEGILPASEYLDRIRRSGDGPEIGGVPTLFWLRADDRALRAACGAGVVLSLALVLGVAPAACLVLLWALYLSFASVGQVFLSYQWDVLLLEAGFLGALLAPWSWTAPPLSGGGGAVPTAALLALWWLLFRLVFQSGVGKLTSGDRAWRDLSAMEYHWWTQPLPNRVAWWARQLPGWCHRAATLGTHVLELAAPLLIFVPGRGRLVAFAGIVALQLLIHVTGSYNFFNVLTVVLALLLLDDAAWAELLPPLAAAVPGGASTAADPGGVQVMAGTVVLAAALLVGGARLIRTAGPEGVLPAPVQGALRRIEPWRTINGYGLFRVMTKRRPEIVVQGSRDGEEWRDYVFRWKPGAPERAPRYCAPHQPRLDWQMWFAALGRFRFTPWFHAFLERLLRGSEAVQELLEEVPFEDGPPRYVRALRYEYRFTDVEERRRTGRWWTRELRGVYAPPRELGHGTGGGGRRPDRR
jgi:hypothetical protein